MTVLVLLLAGFAAAAPMSEAAIDWLKTYPLAPYREHWSMTVEVKDLKKGVPAVMKAMEKQGAQLMVPLDQAVGSPSAGTQQLSYRLPRSKAEQALKGLKKAGTFGPPIVRQSGEKLPVDEIRKKVSALASEKKANAADLAKMPAISALVDAVLGHLATAQAVAEKTEPEVLLNLTVQGPAAP